MYTGDWIHGKRKESTLVLRGAEQQWAKMKEAKLEAEKIRNRENRDRVIGEYAWFSRDNDAEKWLTQIKKLSIDHRANYSKMPPNNLSYDQKAQWS